MKIKIDGDGCLWIERAGDMKIQLCPFNTTLPREGVVDEMDGMVFCGDWCPLFHEFEIDGKPALELCRAYFPEGEIEELMDERGGE